MDRRTLTKGIAASFLAPPAEPKANPLLILRFLFGTGARVGVSGAVRAAATSAVERQIIINGARHTVRTVATREIGISLSGVAFISLMAAKKIEQYDCKNICIIGKDKGISCTPSSPTPQAMNFTINLFNTITGDLEWERSAYITPKEFSFSIDFPLYVQNGVKHLIASSPQKQFDPIRSTNFYLAHPTELFAE
jgi:hypothetical protein